MTGVVHMRPLRMSALPPLLKHDRTSVQPKPWQVGSGQGPRDLGGEWRGNRFLAGRRCHGPQRVELNALVSSRRFIDFIEQKLAEHGISKVIPEAAGLADAYRLFVRGQRPAARGLRGRCGGQGARANRCSGGPRRSASAHSMIYRAIILALAAAVSPRAHAVECRTEHDHIGAGRSWTTCDDGWRSETWHSRIGGADYTEIERAPDPPPEH